MVALVLQLRCENAAGTGRAGGGRKLELKGPSRHAPLVAERSCDPFSTKSPTHAERSDSPAVRQIPVLANLMVETTQAQAIEELIAPTPRQVDDVVVLEVLPRRASRSHASESVTPVNRVGSPARMPLRVIPGADKVFQECQK